LENFGGLQLGVLIPGGPGKQVGKFFGGKLFAIWRLGVLGITLNLGVSFPLRIFKEGGGQIGDCFFNCF